jgi:hypothetical protein
MFERFTEKARRVIRLAHYEASSVRAPYIETEHFLLGLLREHKELAQILSLAPTATETIRAQIEARTLKPCPPGSATVDLPLSNECKRVLAYAGEEAERLLHRYIGTEHLLLGLLREEGCFGATLLEEHGVTLNIAREKIAAMQPPLSSTGDVSKRGRFEVRTPARPPRLVEIHGHKKDLNQLQPIIADLLHFYWEKREWKAQDLLLHRLSQRVSFYHGQPYDEKVFQLVKGGWSRDRCELCRWELSETAEAAHGTAYTNGRVWLCTECAEKFVIPMKRAGGFAEYT